MTGGAIAANMRRYVAGCLARRLPLKAPFDARDASRRRFISAMLALSRQFSPAGTALLRGRFITVMRASDACARHDDICALAHRYRAASRSSAFS